MVEKINENLKKNFQEKKLSLKEQVVKSKVEMIFSETKENPQFILKAPH